MKDIDLSGQGAAYIRVSLETQDVQRQRESIRFFCQNNGVELSEKWWFEDEGFFRDDESRPALRRMLALVEQQVVNWIVVDSRERIDMQNPRRFMGFLENLERWGCKLFTVDGTDWSRSGLSADMMAMVDAYASFKEGIDRSWRVLGKQALMAQEGIFLGGLPHFGLDVATYPNKQDMTELWRVVWTPELGKHTRLKVFPDGRTEQWDGRNNMPPIGSDEVRRFTPSLDERKLHAVREIFERYATEMISFNALAAILNRMEFRAGLGGMFSGTHIRSMLSQAAYVGKPSWNRRHVGKFHGWTENRQTRMAKPQTKNGKKKFERNPEEDWIISLVELYPPIVNLQTWEAVQEKLKCRNPKQRTSRNSAIVLSGMLVCGHCGKPMPGGTRKLRDGSKQIEFYCGSYQKAVSGGCKEKCECKRHTVKQDDVLGYLQEYISDVSDQMETVKKAAGKRNLTILKPGLQGLAEALVAERQILCQMFSSICYELEEPRDQEQVMEMMLGHLQRNPIGFREWLYDYYRRAFEIDNEETIHQKEVAEAELEHLLERHRALPPNATRSQERLNQEILDVERRIEEIELAQNFADEYDKVDEELRNVLQTLQQAHELLSKSDGDGGLRAQAEALRQIIASVIAFFRPVEADEPRETGQTRKDGATKLDRLVIVPKVGDEETIDLGFEDNRLTHGCSRDTD